MHEKKKILDTEPTPIAEFWYEREWEAGLEGEVALCPIAWGSGKAATLLACNNPNTT